MSLTTSRASYTLATIPIYHMGTQVGYVYDLVAIYQRFPARLVHLYVGDSNYGTI